MAISVREPSQKFDGYPYDPTGEAVAASNVQDFAPAGTVETNVPSTASSTDSWTNLTEVKNWDKDTEANIRLVTGASAVPEYLRLSNFGFNVPSGATMLGVEVLYCRQDGVGADNDHFNEDELKLAWGASAANLSTTNKFTGAQGVNSTETLYGGPTDLWGETSGTITPTVVNSTDFGCVVKVGHNNGTSQDYYLDFVGLAVYYTETVDGNVRLSKATALVIGSTDIEAPAAPDRYRVIVVT